MQLESRRLCRAKAWRGSPGVASGLQGQC